jgi:hypothetical protein
MLAAVGTAAGVAGMSEAGAAVVSAQSFSGTAANDARFTDNPDPARTSNSFTVSGTLKNEAGVPVPNLDVTVSLDPSPAMLIASETDPDAAVGLQLAGSRTDANGRYSVTIPALKNISNYLDGDGTVSLLFTSGPGVSPACQAAHRYGNAGQVSRGAGQDLRLGAGRDGPGRP